MFSVGDAIIVGFVILFVVWLLKRIRPETFASELTHLLRERREDREKVVVEVRPRTSEGMSHVAEEGARLRVVEPAGFDHSAAESNVGRAHVHEDGAFAGGLNRDKGE